MINAGRIIYSLFIIIYETLSFNANFENQTYFELSLILNITELHIILLNPF